MAKSSAVWGIDIGQCAFKALRCSAHPDDPSQIVADAFDYIEYPKILSQPEAEPAEFVRDAIQQFLSRNEVRGDQVAISVSGQSGLARFIKLPPVEAKKIPDIVKYEARQQIPFSLEDVVWDYQQLASGSEDDGFALDTEVGLFAMKRDQVFRALKPLDEAGIKVDFIQLAPLAIYNYIVFDQKLDATPLDEYDPDDPPSSTVVISLGTDTTDLVVTNGFRVWHRSIPLGGSHFTKALTKELRLTFSKAEHLKRHATEAENPKAVFHAMRPVFSDLLTEIQRSINYFSSMDQSAKIGNMVALGNAMKLAGLGRYLTQNLGQDVQPIASFRGLAGGAVTDSPQFKDNLLSFSTCYGLCLQGLKKSSISTNLLPREIVTERLIKEKKPWAVAVAAALLLGCTVNYFFYWNQWRSADVSRKEFTDAFRAAKAVQNLSSTNIQNYQAEKKKHDEINQIGKKLVSNVEGRLAWLEVLKAIDAALPRDPDAKHKDISQRHELHIESLDCQKFDDLNKWFAGIAATYRSDHGLTSPAGASTATPQPASPADQLDDDDETPTAPVSTSGPGPHGPGWVIELRGHHYYNDDLNTKGATFVRQTLLRNLEEATVELPEGTVSVKELGIGYPVLVQSDNPFPVQIPDEDKIAKAAAMANALDNADNTTADAKTADKKDSDAKTADAKTADKKASDTKPMNTPMNPALALYDNDPTIDVLECTFTVQFCWQPVPPSKRREIRQSAPPDTAPGVPADTSADAADTAAADVPPSNTDLAKTQPAGN